MYDLDFPGGVSNDNVKWRALVWIVSESCLAVCFAFSYIPGMSTVSNLHSKANTRSVRWSIVVIRMTSILMLLDFALCLIWLPIGASRSYGLRTAREALLSTCKPLQCRLFFTLNGNWNR